MSDIDEMIAAMALACGMGVVDRVEIAELKSGDFEACAMRAGSDYQCAALARGETPKAAKYALVRHFCQFANARAADLLEESYRRLG